MENNRNPLNGYRYDVREPGIETSAEQMRKLVKNSSSENAKTDSTQDKAIKANKNEIKKVANDLNSLKNNVYTKSQADSKFLTEHQSLEDYAKKADVYTKEEVDAKIPEDVDLTGYAKEEYVDNKISELIAGAPDELDTLKEAADAIKANIDNINALSSGLTAKADVAYVDEKIANVFVNFTQTNEDRTNPYVTYYTGTTDLSQTEIAEHLAAGKLVYLKLNDVDNTTIPYMASTGGQNSFMEIFQDPSCELVTFVQSNNDIYAMFVKVAPLGYVSNTFESIYSSIEERKSEAISAAAENTSLMLAGTRVNFSSGLTDYLTAVGTGPNGNQWMVTGDVKKLNAPDGTYDNLNGFADAGDVKEYVDNFVNDIYALLEEKDTQIYNLTRIVGDLGGAVTYELPNSLGKTFNALMGNNGTVKLTEDVETGRFGPGVSAKNTVTLNLNTHNLTITGLTISSSYPAIMSRGTQTINIGGRGTIDAGEGICVEAMSSGSVINLTGSTTVYHTNRPGGELIYCYSGTINITNGTFRNDGGTNFLLNCYDANYQNGTAKIIVSSTSRTNGPKFYDFNPGDNTAEGAGTSYVAEDCEVVTSTVTEDGVEHTVYTVVKSA